MDGTSEVILTFSPGIVVTLLLRPLLQDDDPNRQPRWTKRKLPQCIWNTLPRWLQGILSEWKRKRLQRWGLEIQQEQPIMKDAGEPVTENSETPVAVELTLQSVTATVLITSLLFAAVTFGFCGDNNTLDSCHDKNPKALIVITVFAVLIVSLFLAVVLRWHARRRRRIIREKEARMAAKTKEKERRQRGTLISDLERRLYVGGPVVVQLRDGRRFRGTSDFKMREDEPGPHTLILRDPSELKSGAGDEKLAFPEIQFPTRDVFSIAPTRVPISRVPAGPEND